MGGEVTIPWTPSNATSHTRKATTKATQKQWSTVANAVLGKTGDDGKAVRIANAAVKKHPSKGHWSKH